MIITISWPVDPMPLRFCIPAAMLLTFTGGAVWAAIVVVESTVPLSVIAGISAVLAALFVWLALRSRRHALNERARVGIVGDGQDAVSRAVEDYLVVHRIFQLGGLAPHRRRLNWSEFSQWMESRGLDCPATVLDSAIASRLSSETHLIEHFLEPEDLGAVDMTSVPLIASMGALDDQRGRRWIAGEATLFVQGYGGGLPAMVVTGPAGRLRLPPHFATPHLLAALWQRWNHPHPRPEL
ncbi:MAG: hypothetical protein IT430_08860 [Phycisphaerales bacterium]|nr:hypothetical protein [Phycisphaerales bacterium]